MLAPHAGAQVVNSLVFHTYKQVGLSSHDSLARGAVVLHAVLGAPEASMQLTVRVRTPVVEHSEPEHRPQGLAFQQLVCSTAQVVTGALHWPWSQTMFGPQSGSVWHSSIMG